MNYLVAVSGGVDSVVLLDMLSRTEHRLIVAHVDHGIRPDSAADARFVAALAKKYHLPYVGTRYDLGPGASEERAREVRYRFLFEKAAEHRAQVVTGHHRGDVLETIALNIARGTGWRGLAVLDRSQVVRPLLALDKSRLYDYACEHGLEWVEDSTNASDVYQRNRLRRAIHPRLDQVARARLAALRSRQLQLKHDIARESARLMAKQTGSRHFLTQIDEAVAIELLGWQIEQAGAMRPTRPQVGRALHAVKTAKPGATHHVGAGVELHFTARKFTVNVV